MKRKVKVFLFLLCVFIMAWGMTANAEGFSISQKAATMNIGDLLELKVSDADKKPVWISYNENIAKVDQNGTVTAFRAGKTTIKVRSGFQTKTCAVKVVNSSIKLNKKTATIYHGGTSASTAQLKATVKGAAKDVAWKSSDINVATVDTKGKVTSVSEGTATITATANMKSASCTVNVKESGIALNMDTMQLSNKGAGSSMKLTPVVIGSKKNVKWISSDKTVATVSSGKVTGKKTGTATITATVNGVSDTCTVSVTEGLVSINEEKIQLYTGGTKTETKQLKTNAGKKDVIVWSSSDDSIATVENGLVTAKGEGTAIINARCNGKTDSCEVTVKNTVTEIGEDTVFLRTKGSDKTYQLNSSVTGRSSSVKWTSSDNKVASVNKGKVTAKKVGTAIITATANGVSDSVIVTVEDYLPTIKLNQSNYVLYTNKGNIINLKATVDGKSKTVSWSSSNKAVATVNKGKVTAVSEGEAIISATANDVTAECLITVRQSKVILENENLHLNKGETGNIPVDVIGKSQTIKWSTTNSKVATVKNGVVTAKNYGEADIKVTANGITAICHVNVSECQHNFDEGKVTKEPSCTEEGTCLYTCTICGYSYIENIPTVEHKWGEWATTKEPTETEMGIQIRSCAICGAEESAFLPVLEHTHRYDRIVTEPTCTEDGYTTYKCSCGDTYTDDIVPALGHKWGEWQVIKEPTEKEAGEKLHVCSICKAEEIEEIPNLSHIHDYKAVVTEPTCTEDGYTIYECSCGDSYTDDIVPALGHKWSDWQIIKEATESEAGEKKRVCSVCEVEETEEIPNLSHIHDYYKAVVTEPTCTEDGYTIYECSCGDSYTDDIVPALGHKWSDWQIIKEATESEAGEKKRVCSVCEVEETESIPVLEHVHKYSETDTVEPTCTEDGYTIYECSCGDSYMDDVIPALGHQYTTIVTEPTCTEQGYTTYTCELCGNYYRDDFVEHMAHELSEDWIITKEPTCMEYGLKVRECSRCGLEMEESVIPETGHNYDEGSITKEATCTESGEKTCTCINCGGTKTETIEATGHRYGDFETITEPADFETFGVAKMVCPECGTVLFDNLTSVLVDAGNGETAVMYGYYDYEEAKKCFDLTYQYKEEGDFFSKSGEFVYEWNDDKYNFSCIRCAEMAYLANQCDTITDFMATDYHQRPNEGINDSGENMTVRNSLYAYLDVEYSAEEAFQAWMNSRGHRENIEDYVSDTSLAQFTVWIPSWNSWDIFWVQNFY